MFKNNKTYIENFLENILIYSFLLLLVFFSFWLVDFSQPDFFTITPVPCERSEFSGEVVKVFNEPPVTGRYVSYSSNHYYLSLDSGEVLEVQLNDFMVIQPGDNVHILAAGCGYLYPEVIKLK